MTTIPYTPLLFMFFYTDTPTPNINTLSLHDALPIYDGQSHQRLAAHGINIGKRIGCRYLPKIKRIIHNGKKKSVVRSEEHTSELQSRGHLVCRLLLEKKKKTMMSHTLLLHMTYNLIH